MEIKRHGRALLIPGMTVCGNCKRVLSLTGPCICTVTGTDGTINDEEGVQRMSSLSFPCPHCGQSHLMIMGGTVVADKHGGLVAVCPNYNKKVANHDE